MMYKSPNKAWITPWLYLYMYVHIQIYEDDENEDGYVVFTENVEVDA